LNNKSRGNDSILWPETMTHTIAERPNFFGVRHDSRLTVATCFVVSYPYSKNRSDQLPPVFCLFPWVSRVGFLTLGVLFALFLWLPGYILGCEADDGEAEEGN